MSKIIKTKHGGSVIRRDSRIYTISFDMLKLVLQNQQIMFLILERMNDRKLTPDVTIKQALRMQMDNIKKWEKKQK
jgi:hypothetical protein